jgi:hypothetical protein
VSLELQVDKDRWERHLDGVVAASPGLVPVIKGNGYGFGNPVLLAQAARLGADLTAVGTTADLAGLEPETCGYAGEVLVMVPWRAVDPAAPDGWKGRVVHTIGHASDVAALGEVAQTGQGIVVELATSMLRHGVPAGDLPALARALAAAPDLDLRGFAVHLPLPGYVDVEAEVEDILATLADHEIPVRTLFVSHVTAAHVEALRHRHPTVAFRPRVGTALWLGDRAAYRAVSAVLDVHPLARGQRYGYRARRALTGGHLVVVSGGTANGISTEPPAHTGSIRKRVATLASGGLEAAGFAMSPYTVTGSRRWFAEPPHMQVSMLLLPPRAPVPAVGDEVPVNVGMTLTRFDRIVWS